VTAEFWGGEDLARSRRELRVQQLALPLSLAVAWVLVSTSAGQFFVRTFLSMWLHELGHASAAWFCGHGAVPGPWRTWWSQGRVAPVILVIAASLGGLGWLGWCTGRRDLVAAAVLGLTLRLACTVLAPDAAGALITFGGDGGGMLLGTALMATIWSDPESRLGRGTLRWGLLAI
jgi:hypothetical protein